MFDMESKEYLLFAKELIKPWDIKIDLGFGTVLEGIFDSELFFRDLAHYLYKHYKHRGKLNSGLSLKEQADFRKELRMNGINNEEEYFNELDNKSRTIDEDFIKENFFSGLMNQGIDLNNFDKEKLYNKYYLYSVMGASVKQTKYLKDHLNEQIKLAIYLLIVESDLVLLSLPNPTTREVIDDKVYKETVEGLVSEYRRMLYNRIKPIENPTRTETIPNIKSYKEIYKKDLRIIKEICKKFKKGSFEELNKQINDDPSLLEIFESIKRFNQEYHIRSNQSFNNISEDKDVKFLDCFEDPANMTAKYLMIKYPVLKEYKVSALVRKLT